MEENQLGMAKDNGRKSSCAQRKCSVWTAVMKHFHWLTSAAIAFWNQLFLSTTTRCIGPSARPRYSHRPSIARAGNSGRLSHSVKAPLDLSQLDNRDPIISLLQIIAPIVLDRFLNFHWIIYLVNLFNGFHGCVYTLSLLFNNNIIFYSTLSLLQPVWIYKKFIATYVHLLPCKNGKKFVISLFNYYISQCFMNSFVLSLPLIG